ncbi:Uncharacterized protein DAT39_013618 [Clarias magur]|uniref:Uncharacterized protein n=1 Tax=Clarias magur TaxID=1594786 RepID=A0A8J4TJN1_CLAMG|nr:Uncharacterized protein DAT39_013618 [Clarias magur]
MYGMLTPSSRSEDREQVWECPRVAQANLKKSGNTESGCFLRVAFNRSHSSKSGRKRKERRKKSRVRIGEVLLHERHPSNDGRGRGKSGRTHMLVKREY